MSGCNEERVNREVRRKRRAVGVAMGREPADLVLKHASYVNVFTGEILTADIAAAEGLIAGVGSYSGREERDCTGKLVLPGFLDAHIHLESSLVAPAEFVRAVLPHGTTTVVTDPHEIANVMGADGIAYMLQATEGLPVDVRFMLPSCVPATPLDESGAALGREDLDGFYSHPRVQGLAEMMNFVGVLAGDESVLEKLAAADLAGRRIDGHAPDLADGGLNAYIAAGVRSDHECHDLKDAIAKLERGQYIMIREGTAARNLEALVPLLNEKYGSRCLLCTDDKHPGDLLKTGHIDAIIRRAVALGADPMAAVRAATLNAAQYFGLHDRGAVAPGYLADLVIVDDFQSFQVEAVYRKGVLAAEHGAAKPFPVPAVEPRLTERARHTFRVGTLTAEDFCSDSPLGVVGMVDGEITTVDRGRAGKPDAARDILRAAVVERHKGTGHIGLGFLQGYGLKSGAVATSISHDSHNIIVVGAGEAECAAAANRVAELNGGIVVWNDGKPVAEVPLDMGGIMSGEPLEMVNEQLESAKAAAYALGVNRGIDPFMTLSFMALPVIPTLRLTTRGVFDVGKQDYV
ncbi:MAG: adenine deaminase [Oscillibacter sp.]|nr:adenine deaminase [Oscillibacter sp.]